MISMGAIAERSVFRGATTTQSDGRLVGWQQEWLPFGIDERKIAFDHQRAVFSRANSYVGHVINRSRVRQLLRLGWLAGRFGGRCLGGSFSRSLGRNIVGHYAQQEVSALLLHHRRPAGSA